MSQNLFEPRRPAEREPAPPAVPPRDEPSWARIYWNTLRSFVRRNFGRRQRRWPYAAAAVVVVAALVTGTVLLVGGKTGQDHSRNSADADSAGAKDGPGSGPSPEVRTEAARWIATHIGAGQVVACDAAVCGSLAAVGFPVASTVRVGDSAEELQSADVAAVTSTLRRRLGTGIDNVIAPDALAVFGTGDRATALYPVAHAGRAAYVVQASDEAAARRAAGKALLGNDRLSFTGPARQLLGAGRVDMRVCALLATLGGQHTVTVTSFGPAAPGAAVGVPRSALEISTVDRVSAAGHATAAVALRALVTAQRAPYLPLDTAVRAARGQEPGVLSLRYSQPAPLDLLATPTAESAASAAS
ncbi:hypothetical protein [Streptomyces sp. NBC_00370]|uniref:hypothetical protein n=1 Tax=Streptomyces sp. NBC_00370 TaxID=2975728 RepID=UPI002E262291